LASTEQKVALTGTTPANEDCIGVHCAAEITQHNLVVPSSILTIQTPFNVEGWHQALSNAGLLLEFGE